jgi:hypothetical protein
MAATDALGVTVVMVVGAYAALRARTFATEVARRRAYRRGDPPHAAQPAEWEVWFMRAVGGLIVVGAAASLLTHL